MYLQHLSVMNEENSWKCFRPLGYDAVYSDKFFDILEEIINKVWSKYEVDWFRNVGTFLLFDPSSNPRKRNLQSRRLENIGSRIIDVGVAVCY
jgi:hypothetical protein